MPTYQLVRCVQCHLFQCQQGKKIKRWQCVCCGEKQSLLKVYHESTQASQLRILIQDYNMRAGRLSSIKKHKNKAESSEWQATNQDEEVEVEEPKIENSCLETFWQIIQADSNENYTQSTVQEGGNHTHTQYTVHESYIQSPVNEINCIDPASSLAGSFGSNTPPSPSSSVFGKILASLEKDIDLTEGYELDKKRTKMHPKSS